VTDLRRLFGREDLTDEQFRALASDHAENERCPGRGTPGYRISPPGPIEEWACPDCDRDLLAALESQP
jgi:hypothetical protein